MTSFADISLQQLRRAVAIKQKISELESELAALIGGREAPQRGRKRSAAVRARMAAAQRARWAKSTANGHGDPKPRKRRMTAAWRAKIAAAAKARWKKVKAAGRASL
jgi:hypothetical protein